MSALSLQTGQTALSGTLASNSAAAIGKLGSTAAASAAPVAAIAAVPPVPAAMRLRDGAAQGDVGRVQQGLAWLDDMGARLEGIQRQIASAAQQGSGANADLQRQLADLQQLLQTRATGAGGQIDSQLRPSNGGTLQRFAIRGLDMAALAADGDETLRLSLPGPRQLAVPLTGGDAAANLQSLQRALAGTGITVQPQGSSLSFSAPEADIDRLRGTLALRGDGRRFPSGQPIRAQLQLEPGAVQPGQIAQLVADGREGQRRAMGQVFDLRSRVAMARDALRGRLDALAPAASNESPQAMQALAAEFAQGNEAPALDYGRLSDLLAAVRGVHRQRVDQLLG